MVQYGQAQYTERVAELRHLPIFVRYVHNSTSDTSLDAPPYQPSPDLVLCIGDDQDNTLLLPPERSETSPPIRCQNVDQQF
jgi:hypothetical protein